MLENLVPAPRSALVQHRAPPCAHTHHAMVRMASSLSAAAPTLPPRNMNKWLGPVSAVGPSPAAIIAAPSTGAGALAGAQAGRGGAQGRRASQQGQSRASERGADFPFCCGWGVESGNGVAPNYFCLEETGPAGVYGTLCCSP